LLKKVIVVVGEQKEFFEGNRLTVEATSVLTESTALECLLTIKEGETVIASFKAWDYWRETK